MSGPLTAAFLTLKTATLTYITCLAVCVSVSIYDNPKIICSIQLKFEHIVVYGNSSDEFDIGHCLIKVMA